MKDMLTEVNGWCLRVDHPSHIVDTFEGMRCWFVGREKHRFKHKLHTLTMSSVTSSSWRTFALMAPAMQVLCGMSSSLSLWFRKVIKSWTVGHSTNQKGWKVSLPNPAWAQRKCWLTKSQVVIIASRCSWIPSLVTGGIWAGFVTFWPYFTMDCWTSWDVLTKSEC